MKPPDKGAKSLIQQKHREYLTYSRSFRWLYFITRIFTALSSALLPFVLNSYQIIATIFAVTIVICVATDAVFDPKSNWKLYSKATDLLALAELKSNGQYDEYKEQLEILREIEEKRLDRLVDLDALQKKFEKKS